jgi:hypothetical protein
VGLLCGYAEGRKDSVVQSGASGPWLLLWGSQNAQEFPTMPEKVIPTL